MRAIEAELRRIEEQGVLLLRAVRAAVERHQDSDAVATSAEATLSGARAELLRQREQAELAVAQASEAIRAELSARVGRRATLVKPQLRLMVRSLPGGRRILHLARPSPDDAVVLLHIFCRRIPSRFGYLFDDSTDDPLLPAELFFAEEGVDGDTRPAADAFLQHLQRLPTVWPIKAIVPLLVDGLLVLWRARGAVLEAELADGPSFRNLLTEHEAERIVGQLLGLKLEGQLGLELARG
jgi:hypothetical protein